MSSRIHRERKAYYDILERTQKGTLDITLWMRWFLDCLGRAFEESAETLATVLHKARFWQRHDPVNLNNRQRLLLNKLLDGFEGKLTSSRWATIAGCSQDTAIRDIQGLIDHGVLEKDPGGGRSTSYSLVDV
jgi:Fic family protein